VTWRSKKTIGGLKAARRASGLVNSKYWNNDLIRSFCPFRTSSSKTKTVTMGVAANDNRKETENIVIGAAEEPSRKDHRADRIVG
jgi:hypothetical protein